jgi:phosphoribosylanthranilate isomerase
MIAAMTRTRIKICGFTREADVDAAVDAGADALGFMLWPGSARCVTAGRAAELSLRLPPFVTPVLLFVNATPADIARVLVQVPNALLQFHGDEAPAQCQAAGRPYLRAARIRASGAVACGDENVDLLDFAARFQGAQALLLDTHVEGYGGSGKVFDWSLLQGRRQGVHLPLVLSGGLNPANVIDGITRVRPWAVDVSSGVEASKGVKDAELMRRFCQAVREADDRLAIAT